MAGQDGIQSQSADTEVRPVCATQEHHLELETAADGQGQEVRKGLAKYLHDLKSMIFKVRDYTFCSYIPGKEEGKRL